MKVQTTNIKSLCLIKVTEKKRKKTLLFKKPLIFKVKNTAEVHTHEEVSPLKTGSSFLMTNNKDCSHYIGGVGRAGRVLLSFLSTE